jgi:diketogulonate reductase-like aldo/keto reductase
LAGSTNGELDPARALANGVEMPRLGLGLWQVPSGERTERAVTWALETGYRHLDTAQGYGNEASVGRALAASGIPREQVFLTTKFHPDSDDPVAEAERSLERLGVERLDLYLVHWPKGPATAQWAGMERALGRGLTRAIGVSNYSVGQLTQVLEAAETRPMVNQVALSPFTYRRRLVEFCLRSGVAPEAASPLTTGADLADPRLGEVARRTGRTPAQVMLRWGLQRGFVVIPKSVDRDRIAENARIFDFSLSDEDVAALDALDRTGGASRAIDRRWHRLGMRLRRKSS